MDRRAFLAAGAAAAATGTAGCRSMFETRSARSPPLVDDRPDAVYVPTHTEGMAMVGTAEAGDYRVGLTYSFPHRFWTVDADRTNKVEIQGSNSAHLMGTVWDPETGTVVPNSSVEATVTRDGETFVDRGLWPMLSQNMGVHAGDNVGLDGDGTYEVTYDIGPLSARTTGAFAGKFGELESATFTLEFEESTLRDLPFERLTDREGDPGAVDPMDMEIESDGSYLAVSARTPYNRYPLPFMALSATLTRDGESAFEGALQPTFDPDLGYHYGAAADPRDGDDLRLVIDVAPQLARHEGYETAFLDFDPMDLTLSG
ncbi:hypothetical protein BRC70_01710 [Halobacteriales archaeon QH_6_68_27]|nr:MAG: hypothetical protein BRC70_01710 [Halobacteriales archaeon QH_6_68_27]